MLCGVGLLLSLRLLVGSALAEAPPAGHYQISQQSQLQFNVTNFLFTSVDGKFDRFSGDVKIAAPLQASTAVLNIEASSVNTDNHQRDEHLRTKDFFDAQNYPSIRFKSTMLTPTPQGFVLKGVLTIRGISKEIELNCEFTDDPNLIVAKAKIDRQDFGVSSGPTIQNEVRLSLNVKLVKPQCSEDKAGQCKP